MTSKCLPVYLVMLPVGRGLTSNYQVPSAPKRTRTWPNAGSKAWKRSTAMMIAKSLRYIVLLGSLYILFGHSDALLFKCNDSSLMVEIRV